MIDITIPATAPQKCASWLIISWLFFDAKHYMREKEYQKLVQELVLERIKMIY